LGFKEFLYFKGPTVEKAVPFIPKDPRRREEMSNLQLPQGHHYEGEFYSLQPAHGSKLN
jgi:hypothetical protein